MPLSIPDSHIALSRSFRTATPFPHIVLNNLLENPLNIAKSFPDKHWENWKALGDSYQKNKFMCSNFLLFPEALKEVVTEFSQPNFLMFLEQLSGIKRLIPDPYLEGGGLHFSTAEGILAPHTDFHIYEKLGLYRRINLILYLNENWREGDGGELELSHKNNPDSIIRIAPTLGTVVIFETDDNSVHGFRNPVRESTERASVALYYYTSEETGHFGGDQTTHWKEHGVISKRSRPRFFVFKVLLKISRFFSICAQVINPNQGIGLIKWKLRQKR